MTTRIRSTGSQAAPSYWLWIVTGKVMLPLCAFVICQLKGCRKSQSITNTCFHEIACTYLCKYVDVIPVTSSVDSHYRFTSQSKMATKRIHISWIFIVRYLPCRRERMISIDHDTIPLKASCGHTLVRRHVCYAHMVELIVAFVYSVYAVGEPSEGLHEHTILRWMHCSAYSALRCDKECAKPPNNACNRRCWRSR